MNVFYFRCFLIQHFGTTVNVPETKSRAFDQNPGGLIDRYMGEYGVFDSWSYKIIGSA